MPTTNEQYIGSGIVYAGGRDVGNMSKLALSIETDSKTRPNYRGGGGNAAVVELVKAVKLTATLDSFNNENIAMALRGTVSELTGAAVTDENVPAVLDRLCRTDNMIDLSQPVTVKVGALAKVKDVDYTLTAAGIIPLKGGTIASAAEMLVSYKSVTGSVLEALVNSGEELTIVFDGVNENTGKRSVMDVYRWKPAPTSGLDLISDDFAEFDIEGEVLADSTKGAGLSKFFRRIQQD